MGVVSVKDSGPGFDLALSECLFEMFTRALGEGAVDPGGLGIGLSIARALTHAHGGRIEAHSDGPGKGARFSIYLPVVNLSDMPTPLM